MDYKLDPPAQTPKRGRPSVENTLNKRRRTEP